MGPTSGSEGQTNSNDRDLGRSAGRSLIRTESKMHSGDVSDASPPRRRYRTSQKSTDVGDASPPRRKRRIMHRNPTDSDASPPRRQRDTGPGRRPDIRVSNGAFGNTSSPQCQKEKVSTGNGKINVPTKVRTGSADGMKRPSSYERELVSLRSSGGRQDSPPSTESSARCAKLEISIKDHHNRLRHSAPPNRFGILPGPRWDGVNRSNGFEVRLENMNAGRKDAELKAYKASVADM